MHNHAFFIWHQPAYTNNYFQLLVCNVLSSADTNKYLNSISLKSLITVNELFINAIDAQNVSNFIMLSNNFAPEIIKSGDRRYQIYIRIE